MMMQLAEEKLKREMRRRSKLEEVENTKLDIISVEDAIQQLGLAERESPKTSVSKMNEYAAKDGGSVDYEMISSNLRDFNVLEFTMRASYSTQGVVRNFTHGVALTKREAKHLAAQNLYDVLRPNANSSRELFRTPVGSPSTSSRSSSSLSSNNSSFSSFHSNSVGSIQLQSSRNSSFSSSQLQSPVKSSGNYVSALQELLQGGQNKALPIYVELGASGPQHMPQFTVSCSAQGLTMQAIASTKKSARHLAAKYVLDQLKASSNQL